MTDQTDKVLTRAALLLICALAVFAAIRLASAWPIWGHKKAAEWVGAIGAIGAFFAAIALATSDNRRRRKQEFDLAKLIAARHVPHVALAYGTISQVKSILDQALEIDLGPVAFQMAADRLADDVMVSQDDLAAMVSLPNHAALLLAQGIGARDAARELLKKILLNPKLSSDDHAQFRYESAESLASLLKMSETLIKKAVTVMERTSRMSQSILDDIPDA